MTNQDEQNELHWNDPKNWSEGKCGWYFCKEDPRLWVPKKVKKYGTTINLGHPKGGATLVGIFMIPIVFLIIGLLASVGFSFAECGVRGL